MFDFLDFMFVYFYVKFYVCKLKLLFYGKIRLFIIRPSEYNLFIKGVFVKYIRHIRPHKWIPVGTYVALYAWVNKNQVFNLSI